MPYSGWNFTSSLCTRERWKAVNHQYNKASNKGGEKGTRWKDPSLGKWRILQRGWTATGTGTNQVPKERERERKEKVWILSACESSQSNVERMWKRNRVQKFAMTIKLDQFQAECWSKYASKRKAWNVLNRFKTVCTWHYLLVRKKPWNLLLNIDSKLLYMVQTCQQGEKDDIHTCCW